MLKRFIQSAARNISSTPAITIRTMSTSRPYSPSPPVSPSKSTPNVPHHATGFLNFADSSPTPFHAVATAISKLESAGFKRVSERDDFTDASRFPLGSKCYYTRNTSSLVAFVLPKGEMKRGEEALAIVAGHTDSPCLKLRPISKKEKSGYKLVGVETYGGGIWATWFDRDLSIAGRVITRQAEAQFASRLVKIDRPLFRVPTLAIHLDRTINDSWKFNKETQLAPIMSQIHKQVNGSTSPSESSPDKEKETEKTLAQENHDPALLQVLARELDCDVKDIYDFELSLYDTQKGSTSGLDNEFLHTARIDNLMTCYCSIEGIIQSTKEETTTSNGQEGHVRVVCLFDNEEVGSVSYQGAEGDLLPGLVENLMSVPGLIKGSRGQVLKNSFLISSDMGHALNPNYEAVYQEAHRPRMNGGVIIKTNANQRYTSNAPTTFLVRRLAEIKGVPLQEFEVRNDGSCGSTIGPVGSTMGLRTVDIGLPQLSMHSCRETAGTKDPEHMIDLFETFFSHYASVDQQLVLD